MRKWGHIFRKELKSYFVSPIAYIVISVFLLVTGWFFFSTFFLLNQANLRNFFNLLPFVFSFIVPAITMRLFAEELNIGSYETLLTMPVTFADVIVGKFLAAVVFVAAMLLSTLSYAVTIATLGQVDWGPILGGYLGALLLGSSFAAIGLFASILSRNQIVAFIIGMSICFSLTLIDKMLFFLPTAWLGFFDYLGAGTHFENITKGVVDSRDLLYFFSLIFLGLYTTHMVMAEKR